MRLLAIGLCIVFAASTEAQAPQEEKGLVSGIVTNLAGEPLRHATVQLMPVPSIGQVQAVAAPVRGFGAETDSQGNFTIADLGPGRYFLSAERSGYLPAFYTNARGRVVIDPGQGSTGIVIKM